MEEKKQPVNAVKNVFKNGRVPTREEYTNLWIKMINQIERAKANQFYLCGPVGLGKDYYPGKSQSGLSEADR